MTHAETGHDTYDTTSSADTLTGLDLIVAIVGTIGFVMLCGVGVYVAWLGMNRG